MQNYSPNQCIILLFDGARFDVFSNLLAEGKLPNIKRYISSHGTFLKGYSCLSSTTGPAHIPFICGIYPGTANVPGIRWFDKTEAKIKRNIRNIMTSSDSYIRSYVGPQAFAIGTDIVETYIPLYNFFSRPISIFNSLDKNYSVKIKNNRKRTMLYYFYCHYTHQWGMLDHIAARSIKSYIKQGHDFIFSVFPAIDKISHLHHPFHEKALRQYQRLDEYVGEIFHELSAEELSKILIFTVSDHGLSQTHTHVSLVNLSQEEGFTPIYYPKILRKNYDMAIMETGNGMAFIYFMQPVDNRPAFYKELMIIDKNRKFIDRLLYSDGINFIAYRRDDSTLVVSNKNGELKLDFKSDGYVSLTSIGDNPLEFISAKDKISLNETLSLTMNTNYPDSIVQLKQLFSSNRTGDLVIFAKDGFDLREKHEWPEHKSSHGSISKSHMEVPICTNIKLSSTSCRTVDIFPTILHKLGYDIPRNIDGKVIV